MPYYALYYELVDDYLERRTAFRDNHLQMAREAHARGEIILAGAFSDPADSALLIFRAPDPSLVNSFARQDPYVRNGLVKRWEVRSWNVVVGNSTE